ANGRIDRVTAHFSEALAPSDDVERWTLAGVPSEGTRSHVSTTGATATLLLTEGPGARDTAVGAFTVALTNGPGGVRDATGNPASAPATAPSDDAAPAAVARVMQDRDRNGKVDAVTVTFSEDVNPSTATTPWTLAHVPSDGALASVLAEGRTAILEITEGPG